MFTVARLLLQATRPHDTRLGDWPLMCPPHGQFRHTLPAVTWCLLRAFLVAVASACPEANHVHGLLQVAQALRWEGRAAWRLREAMAGAGGGRGASWWSDPEEMEEVFVSEGEDAPPADPLAPPRGPPPPVPVNEPVHLPRRKKECSQKISMAISQALLERGQSSEVILTTFDEDIPVTGDVGLIHVRIGKLSGEHLRSPWAVWTGSQSEGEDLPFDRDRDDGGDYEVHSLGFLQALGGAQRWQEADAIFGSPSDSYAASKAKAGSEAHIQDHILLPDGGQFLRTVYNP